MSLLLIIWSVSLVVLSTILGFAFAYTKRSATPQHRALFSGSFGEFLAEQCHEALYYLQKGIHHARPHAQSFSQVVMRYSARGHDFFVERVFGRMEAKKGVSTSFFLKSIAEHKVERRPNSIVSKM